MASEDIVVLGINAVSTGRDIYFPKTKWKGDRVIDSVAGDILNAIITLGKTSGQLDWSLLQSILNDDVSVLFILSQAESVWGW